MSRRKDLFVVIVGCGRLGSYIAGRLGDAGCSIVAVDANEAAFRGLPSDYSGFTVEGDATEIAVLRKARIKDADVVIGATRDDNVNLMIAQIASRVFQIPNVIIRIFEPRHESLCRRLGIRSICPTTLTGDRILDSLAGSVDCGKEGEHDE